MQKKVCDIKKGAFKIALIYALSSIIWITTTDWILSEWNQLHNVWLNSGKGILFVIATAFLLQKLIRNI